MTVGVRMYSLDQHTIPALERTVNKSHCGSESILNEVGLAVGPL